MLNGADIRNKRKSLGLTAGELADLLQVDRANLYKWEKGHKPTDPEDYLKLEKWLIGKIEAVPKINGKPDITMEAGDLAQPTNLYERLIAAEVARRIELEARAKRAEEKEDTLMELLKENLTQLLANSNRSLQDLAKILLVNRVDDGKIMDNQDIAAGRELGSSAKEAGMLEVKTEMAALLENQQLTGKGKTAKVSKTHKG